MVLGPILLDYTVILALAGTALIGMASGVLSCFAVLRKQSLFGDVVAHASLPGICIAFMLTSTKESHLLLLGALGSGCLGACLISVITRRTLLKTDTALGIILSVFFGIGIFLLTVIQRMPTARQSGLETFLFGSVSSLLLSDLWILSLCCCCILISVSLFWKEFKCLVFDENYFLALGFPLKKIDILLTSLLVISIIIGLQTVGVILMSALIIAPGVAARQWTHSLFKMVVLSACISMASSLVGVLISSSMYHLPTGPVIVLVVSSVVVFSLFFSPKRGILVQYIKRLKDKKFIHTNMVLSHLYSLAKSHDDLTHPHDSTILELICGKPTHYALLQLETEGYVASNTNNLWGLTEKGIKKAKQLEKQGR